MASFWTDLEVAEMILGEVTSFVGGNPVEDSRTIGGTTYTLEVQVLANGPTGTPFQVISGGFFGIFGAVVVDIGEATSGVPVQIAQKIGNTWFGYTLSSAPAK
jgi:hypothetical protein